MNPYLLVRPLYDWETSQFLTGRQPFIAGHQLVFWEAGISRGVLLSLLDTLLTVRIISRISPVKYLWIAIILPKTTGLARRIAAFFYACLWHWRSC